MNPNLAPGAGFVSGRGNVSISRWKTAESGGFGPARARSHCHSSRPAGTRAAGERGGRVGVRLLSGAGAVVKGNRGDRA